MRQALRVVASLGVSMLVLALLLRLVNSGLDDQQRPGVLAILQSTSFKWLFVSLGVYLLSLLFRAARYRLLLSVSGETNVPTFWQMAQITGIRNMIVDMLPARIGELGYVALLNRAYGVAIQHCVSSLTISFAFDFLALLMIVLTIVGVQFFANGVQLWAMAALLLAIFLSVIAFLVLFLMVPMISQWLQKNQGSKQGSNTSQSLSWHNRSLKLLSNFERSINNVRRSGRTGAVFGLSLVVRVLKYSGLYCLFIAVVKNSYPELLGLPSETILSALVGGEVAASLPVPGFMSFGVYEVGATLVFQLLGVVDQVASVLTMLCTHIWSQFMEYILGGLLMVLLVLQRPGVLSGALAPSDNESQLVSDSASVANSRKPRYWVSVLFTALLLMMGLYFFASELRAVNKIGPINAPSPGQTVMPAMSPNDETASDLLPKGFVVFSSNRDGNHDIFKLSLPSRTLTKLSSHKNTETYPRISPDGRKLVFSRAQQEWVPQRNLVAWDIYILDLQTQAQTKVGSNGTSPRWIDNHQITYLQNGETVVRVDILTGKEQTIYQTGVNNKMPSGSRLSNPSLNPVTDQLVFTARQRDIGMSTGHWGTAIQGPNGHTGVLNGCELAWSSNGEQLFQVTAGAVEREHKIVVIDPSTLKARDLVNLDGEFSHEYWPKDSNDGQYLVFGASRGIKEHEHDSADYEIFLWKFGSPSGHATRLTFHTGNDNWPDVYIND